MPPGQNTKKGTKKTVGHIWATQAMKDWCRGAGFYTK